MKIYVLAFLLLAGCATQRTPSPPSTSISTDKQSAPAQAESKPIKSGNKDLIGAIQKIASVSKCITHNWKERGPAPSSYIKGMALVYARALCKTNDKDVTNASAPIDLSKKEKDAFVAYANEFKNLKMNNDSSTNILRHNYALLIGLGMRESSGKYCEGRDVSQCFVEAENAEAGLFQTSYGAYTEILSDLYKKYNNNERSCLTEEFGGSNVICNIKKSQNPCCPWATSDVAGTGPGADWQKMTKACPAFATEYAAVVLRKNGGSRGEFNPIRKHQVELLPECDSMLEEIQSFVKSDPEACSAL